MSHASPRPRRAALQGLVASALVILTACAPAAAARVPRPTPQAKAAIVVDARTGEPLLAEGADEPREIASTTKLMTALLALERSSPADVFTAPRYDAAAVESQIGLRKGERMRMGDLLTALLLASANDAAVDIARNVGGSVGAFVRDMNVRARELGLRSTTYSNPIGLDSARNRSSARDLAMLTRILLRNPLFARTVDRPRARLRSGRRPRTVRNRNTLVEDHPFVDGVKTGHTLAAGYVLVGAARGRGAQVVSVVLGAPSVAARNAGSLALLRFGIDQFRRVRATRAGEAVARRPASGRDDAVVLAAARTAKVTLRRGRRLERRVRASKEIEGPLPAGRRAGSLEIRDGPRLLATVPLVTAGAVAAPQPFAALRSSPGALIALTSGAFLAILFSVFALRVGGRRRRRPRATSGGR